MNRADGYRVSSTDPMYLIVPYIMCTKPDASNNIRIDVDYDPLKEYTIDCRKRGISMSHMAIVIAAYVRIVSQNPYLNRFVMNKKIYARNHLCVCFVTLAPNTGGETVNKVYFDLDDDIFTVNEKIQKVIEKTKNEGADNSMDKLANIIIKIPGLLQFGVSVLKFIDKHFSLPFSIIDASPFHTSMFITNLASIRSNAVHHHLYEFGSTCEFIALGQPQKVTIINDDGEAEEKKVVEFCVTTDERIADGAYYARCFREINRYFANPRLLEKKPEKIVWDPDIRCKNPKWKKSSEIQKFGE